MIALLDQVFPEYDTLFSDTFGVSSKEILLKYPTSEDMLSVSTRKLSNLLYKSSHGRLREEKARQLKAVASTSFGIHLVKDAFSFQICQLLEQIIFLEKQIGDSEAKIPQLLQQTNSFITTIPGIGDTLGAIILSEIGDIHRFSSSSKLVTFSGLDVTIVQSGEFAASK